MPNIIFYGEIGHGKSTTALLVARELALLNTYAFKTFRCEAIKDLEVLEEVYSKIEEGDIVLFDGIDSLNETISLFLIDALASDMPSTPINRRHIPDFMVMATADDLSVVTPKLKVVFSVFEQFSTLAPENIAVISKQIIAKLGLIISDEATPIIVEASGGKSATANHIISLAMTFIKSRQLPNEITKEILNEAIQIYLKGVEQQAVDDYDRKPIPSKVRDEVWRRDEGKCAKCGSRKNLEFDHIVPVSKGGSNTARNIELLCQDCNRAKSDLIQ